MIGTEISLRPQKGSLTDLINRLGGDFHKSPEVLALREKASKQYQERLESLREYLYQADLPLDVFGGPVYHWDGSEEAKNFFQDLWQEKIQDELDLLRQRKIEYWKEFAADSGIPLAWYLGEDETPEEEPEPEKKDETSQINEEDYTEVEHRENALIDDDGFEVVVKKRKTKSAD